MATKGAIGAMQAEAIAEIHAAAAKIAQAYAVESVDIPRSSRFGVDMLQTKQLQAMAAWLTSIADVVTKVDYDKWTMTDLEAEANRRELDVIGTGANGKVVKADLVKALSS